MTDALGDAGYKLPIPVLLTAWRHGPEALQRVLRAVAYLARPVVTIAATAGEPVRMPTSTAGTIEWNVDGRAFTTEYPKAIVRNRCVANALSTILRDLNRELARHGEHRFLLIKRRLLFLDRPWLAVASRTPDVELDCLDPDELATLEHQPPPTTTPARVPTIEQIVGPGNYLWLDTECGSRPEDVIALIATLARFMQVELEIDPNVPDCVSYTVRHAGIPTTLVLDNERIPEIGPIVRYLLSVSSPGITVRWLDAISPHYGLARITTPGVVDHLIAAGYTD